MIIVNDYRPISQTWGQFNSGIDGQFEIAYLKKNGIDKFGIEVCYTIKLSPQINLPFNFLIQKYFFHDKTTWTIYHSDWKFRVGTQEQVFRAPTHGKR